MATRKTREGVLASSANALEGYSPFPFFNVIAKQTKQRCPIYIELPCPRELVQMAKTGCGESIPLILKTRLPLLMPETRDEVLKLSFKARSLIVRRSFSSDSLRRRATASRMNLTANTTATTLRHPTTRASQNSVRLVKYKTLSQSRYNTNRPVKIPATGSSVSWLAYCAGRLR